MIERKRKREREGEGKGKREWGGGRDSPLHTISHD